MVNMTEALGANVHGYSCLVCGNVYAFVQVDVEDQRPTNSIERLVREGPDGEQLPAIHNSPCFMYGSRQIAYGRSITLTIPTVFRITGRNIRQSTDWTRTYIC